MRQNALKFLAAVICLAPVACVAAASEPHNVVLFVADGLRARSVNPQSAPTLAALSKAGVWFRNSHALFPTFTMPNSSAMATGHHLGDTGVFSNTLYTAFPVASAARSVTPFLENDAVLGEVDEHFSGNFINEEAILAAAHKAGYSTAAVGKLGPIGIQAGARRDGATTIVVDDLTGRKGGVGMTESFAAALKSAGIQLEAPTRGDNGKAGDARTPGTVVANRAQQQYFVDIVTKVILPRFKEAGKPFVLVFWSRDPDGTQHNQGDSLGKLIPGINGPTSMAAIRNADDNLAAIKSALAALGLEKTTNIVVTADHGFSTISKQSRTSPSAKVTYADVPPAQLPPGFVAIDLAHAFGLPLHDPDAQNIEVDYRNGKHPSRANGLIGRDPTAPDVIVAANGGSDLIYLPQSNAKDLASKVVRTLLEQDYVSGLFVADALGRIPGTLPLSAINLQGSARTPTPAIVVNFASRSTGCAMPDLCAVEVADTLLQQGQGMHGNFSRGDTYNFMAASGPDFRARFIDLLPASNADIGRTLAKLLGLPVVNAGKLTGRILTEAMRGGKAPKVFAKTLRSAAGAHSLRTVLKYQVAGSTRYFKVAGFPGRVVGMEKSVNRP